MFIPIIVKIPIYSILLNHNWNFIPKHFSLKKATEKEQNVFSELRKKMVSEQIQQRGITNSQILEAFLKVPRHKFVLPGFENLAYIDSPLTIDHHQTISQPYIVAYMIDLADIKPDDKVLEIGTGSGYQTAILAELAKEVYSVEIIPALTNKAYQTLKKIGYDNINLRMGDGHNGWAKHAPYQRILVSAAPEKIPLKLIDQLTVNGKMILPIGKDFQRIIIVTKTGNGISIQDKIPVSFVPMIATN